MLWAFVCDLVVFATVDLNIGLMINPLKLIFDPAKLSLTRADELSLPSYGRALLLQYNLLFLHLLIHRP